MTDPASPATLHRQLAQLGYPVPPEEQAEGMHGPGTAEALRRFGEDHGVADPSPQALAAAIAAGSYTVRGRVSSPDWAALGGLVVELLDVNLGGAEPLARGETAADGRYQLHHLITRRYLRGKRKEKPDLQVRLRIGTAIAATSAVRYDAPRSLTLDLAVPAGTAGLASEYETLAADLARLHDGPPATLPPDGTPYLAGKTGWDARAIAMAMAAGHLAQDGTAGGLAPELIYALLRAGVPAEPGALLATPPAQAEAVWRAALEANIIPARLAATLPQARAAFEEAAAQHALGAAAPAGLSTLQEMLGELLPDRQDQARFSQLHTRLGADPAALWPAMAEAFGAPTAARLQLAGQLHAILRNNAPLLTALTAAEAAAPITSTLDLAARGYAEPARWLPLLGPSVPPGVPGADAAERQARYAALLAAQIRLAHPTAAIAALVARGALPIADRPEVADAVHALLRDNQDGFVIGREPIERYLARTGQHGVPAPVIGHVKRLQRLYQLTPDDRSMAVLLRHGLDSAYAVTRYDRGGFVRAFAAKLGGEAAAQRVHARARQVFGTVLNAAIAYATARRAPAIAAAPMLTISPQDATSPATATLEALFGSLDSTSCEDCASILSPAAYLVDLLNFIDQPVPTNGFLNPQDVLFQRRPDLQDLALTCANTDTALPYIDVALEVMEYFVANGLSMAGYAGHDTDPSLTSAELLAGPSFVDDQAYTVLAAAAFPAPLPFNRPLTLLRLQLAALGVALPDALAALRADDSFTSTATAISYGWQDILIERAGLSRDELALFTDDGTAQSLGALYGLPDATALATLQAMSLEDLTRRLGITYDALLAIIQTSFINPSAWLIPRLQALGVPFTTIAQLYAGTLSPAAFTALLPPGLDATRYGGATATDLAAIATWATSQQVYPFAMALISVGLLPGQTDPSSGANLQLRYANPTGSGALAAADWLKLIRFVRLWPKIAALFAAPDDATGIEQTDAVLGAFFPATDQPPPDDPALDEGRTQLNAGFQTTLLRLGFFMQVRGALGLSGNTSLEELLACWAPIETDGANALYNRLFLTPARLQQDQEAQTATVAGTFTPGSVLTAVIDGVAVSYATPGGETASAIASAVASAINATAALDTRFYAASSGSVVTIRTGFTLACSVSTGATETYTATATLPVQQTATIAATALTPGDVLTTVINGIATPCTVAAGDTVDTLAQRIALAIAGTLTPDPFSGRPLNEMVLATASPGGVVELLAVNAGAPFTLACSTSPADGSYTAAPIDLGGITTLTLAGTPAEGDVVTVNIFVAGTTWTAIPTTASATDTDLATLASDVANTLASNQGGWLVADSGGGSITSQGAVITLDLPQLDYQLNASADGALTVAQTGPTPISQTATIAGSVPPGSVLTTFVSTLQRPDLYAIPVSYTAVAGDTPETIAAAIAAAINATTTPGPYNTGPLNQNVVASSDGAVLTVAMLKPVLAIIAEQPAIFTCQILTSGSYTAAAYIPAGFTADAQYSLSPYSFITTIDGVALTCTPSYFLYTAQEIVAQVNQSLAIDPVSLLPISQTIRATLTQAGLIRFSAVDPTESFTVTTAVQGTNTGWGAAQYTVSGPTPASQTATVVEPMPPGAVLTTVLNGITIPYTVQAADTAGSIAAGIAAAINACTAADPRSNLPLNTLLAATSSAATLTVAAATPVIPFTMSVALDAGSFTAGRQQSPFLRDAYGDILADPSQTVFGYAPLLSAACNLAGSDFVRIAAALGFDAATPLTLADVSAVFRTGWLPRALGLSVLEFLELRRLAGFDPFAGIDPAPAAPVEPPVILFLRLYDAMQAASLTPDQALYLIWNDDISGTAAPALSDVTALALALRGDFAAATAQFSIKVDPDGSIAQSLMTLVYGAAATALFFSLLGAPQTDPRWAPFFQTYPELEPFWAAYAASTSPDDQKRLTLLASILPLLVEQRKQEQALARVTSTVGADPSFAATLLTAPAILHAAADPASPAIADLLAVETGGLAAQIFLGSDPTAPPDLLLDAGALSASLQAVTFTGAIAAGDTLGASVDGVAATVTAPGSDAGAAASALATALAAALAATPPTSGNQVQVVARGGAVLVFATDPTGAGALPVVTATSSGAATPTVAPAPFAITWSGYLTVTQDGDYALTVQPATSVTLSAAGQPWSGAPAGTAWTSAAAAFSAGDMTALTLTVPVPGGAVTCLWNTAGSGWQPVPTTALFSLTQVQRLQDSYTRLRKVIALAGALSLSAAEMAYLGGIGPAHYNDLAVTAAPAASPALTTLLTTLLDFAALKQALSPADGRLLAVLQAPAAILPNGLSALDSLTGWSDDTVAALLTRFFGSPDRLPLATVANFRRVFDAAAILATCRVSATTLLSAVTNQPAAATVGVLQSALRALYAEADWLTAVTPINDALRTQARDALVAYIVQQLTPSGIDSADKLFEYFLLDPLTQPPVQTSRIRLALSSVQLFIERVLRSLEPAASPADLEAAQWTWMKRYRVWQANREIFLWPENWLYPELRDDQSPIFKDTTSRMLQSDLTADAASDAYLDYLEALEAVAKLEICGLYHEPATPTADEISHVIARTAGAHRKYYFRQLTGGSWTPWQQVQIECEDLPLTPIVWNGRLFLFWLKVIKQGQPNTSTTPPDPGNPASGGPISGLTYDDVQYYSGRTVAAQSSGLVLAQAALCWTEYYNGKWQPTKTSDLNRPTAIGYFDPQGANSFEAQREMFAIVTGSYGANAALLGAATMNLAGALPLSIVPASTAQTLNWTPANNGGGFLLHNTHSRPIRYEDVQFSNLPVWRLIDPPPYGVQLPEEPPGGGTASASFSIAFLSTANSNTPPQQAYSFTLFGFSWTPRFSQSTAVATPQSPAPDAVGAWSTPFFYEDRRNAFYVTVAITLPAPALAGFGLPFPLPAQPPRFIPLQRPHTRQLPLGARP